MGVVDSSMAVRNWFILAPMAVPLASNAVMQAPKINFFIDCYHCFNLIIDIDIAVTIRDGQFL